MKRFLVNILYDFTFWYLWLYMETFSVLHNCMNSDAVRFLMWTLQLWRCLTDWWTTTDNLNQDLSSFLRELWYHWCMHFDFRGFSKSYKKRYEFFHTYNIYVNMKWILWGKILNFLLLQIVRLMCMCDFNVLHLGSEKNYSVLVAMDIVVACRIRSH